MIGARRLMAAKAAAGGGGFDPETDIAWEHLWWCESVDFIAEGYSDTDEITSFPDSVGTGTLTPRTTGPIFVASDANFNGQPSAQFVDLVDGINGTLDASVSAPFSVVFIARSDNTGSNSRAVLGAGDQAYIRSSSSGPGQWRMYTPTGLINTDTKLNGTSTAAVFCEAVFNGASSKLREDGATLASGNPGAATLSTEFGINTYGDVDNGGLPIDVVLVGVYSGDITADGSYSAFKSWAADHYGITIA